MLRVKAIAGEPTRFYCSSDTLVCDNAACSKAYNRLLRHQTVLGKRYPTEYLRDGDPCPRCKAKVLAWVARCNRERRVVGKEPVLGVMRERFLLVDLAAFHLNSGCSCEYFECALAPKLKGMSVEEQATGKHRCKHIEAVRDFALDVALHCHERERYAGTRQREEAQP